MFVPYFNCFFVLEKRTENGLDTRDVSAALSRDHHPASAAIVFSPRPTFSSSRSNVSVAETRNGREYNHIVHQPASPVSFNTVTSIQTNQSRSSLSSHHSFNRQSPSNDRFSQRTKQLHNIPNKDMTTVNKNKTKDLPVSRTNSSNVNKHVEPETSCFDSASDNDDSEFLSVEINERTEKRVHNNLQLNYQKNSDNFFELTTDSEFLSKSTTLCSTETNISFRNKGNHWKNTEELMSNQKPTDSTRYTPRNTSHKAYASATFSSGQVGLLGKSANRTFPSLWVKLPLKVVRREKRAKSKTELPATSPGSGVNTTHKVQIYSNSAATKTVVSIQFHIN